MKRKRIIPEAILSLMSNQKVDVYYSKKTLLAYTLKNETANNEMLELDTKRNATFNIPENYQNAEEIDVTVVGRASCEGESDELSFVEFKYRTKVIKVSQYVFENFDVKRTVSRRFLRALHFATTHHSKQIRKCDNSPYLTHLLEVVDLLVTHCHENDEDVLISALLHDVIEDTNVSFSVLLNDFGSRVAGIVSFLSDDKKLNLDERRVLTVKKFDSAPFSVRKVKIADLCSNVVHIPSNWTIDRKNSYLSWTDLIASKCANSSTELFKLYCVSRELQCIQNKELNPLKVEIE
jgi:hypothetical protein